MNSTAYNRTPLAHPSAPASAISCQVSNGTDVMACSLLLAQRFGHPFGRAARQERRDSLASLIRRADRGDALGGVGNHALVDRTMRNRANQRLDGLLCMRSRDEQPPEQLVDARIEALDGRNDVVHESDAIGLRRIELLGGYHVTARMPRADRFDDIGSDRRR